MEKHKYTFGQFKSELIFPENLDFLKFPFEKKILYIFDDKTAELFGGNYSPKVVLPGGEKAKNWDSVSRIINAALENGLARDSLFIGVGGGIICDISAFAASAFMRGCRIALVPTTLLAMVDASIGGKTGFNFRGYKNMVGTFYPAESVFINPQVLITLPEKEMLAGIAENIKHACLGDEQLFRLLDDEKDNILGKDISILTRMIRKSILVKVGIVTHDLRESGIRAYLNLGHTFAHALESAMSLEESQHGEAVAWGLAMAMQTGMRLGITDPSYGNRVIQMIEKYGYALKKEFDHHDFLNAMGKDKKMRKGNTRFVLQKSLGETIIRDVEEELVETVLLSQKP